MSHESRPTRRPQVPAVAWSASAAFVLLLMLGTFLQPPLEIPDERFHVDMIQAVAGGTWPGLQDRTLGALVSGAGRLLRPPGRSLAERALPRGTAQNACEGAPRPRCEARPTVAQVRSLDLSSRTVNRMTQHPPLYYVVQAAAVDVVVDLVVPVEDLGVDVLVWLYRVVSIAMLAPLPWLAVLIARRLSSSRHVHHAAAVFPLCLSGLVLRNGPMVNNDDLTVLLMGIILLVVLHLVQEGVTWGRTITLGVLAGLAALTKGTALVAAPVVGAGYLVALVRDDPRERPRHMLHSVAAGALILLVGAWWYLRNLVLHGRLQPSGVPESLVPAAGPAFEPELLHWAQQALVRPFRSFWGGHALGSLQDALPALLPLVAVLGGLLIAGLAGLARLPRDRRVEAVLMILPLIVVGLLLPVRSWQTYLETATIRGLHARYLYLGLAGLAAVVPLGLAAWAGRRTGWLAPTLSGLAMLLLTLGTRAWLLAEWGPGRPVSLVERWGAMLAWAPVPPWAVNVTGVLASAGLGLVAVLCLVSAGSDSPATRPLASPPSGA